MFISLFYPSKAQQILYCVQVALPNISICLKMPVYIV